MTGFHPFHLHLHHPRDQQILRDRRSHRVAEIGNFLRQNELSGMMPCLRLDILEFFRCLNEGVFLS